MCNCKGWDIAYWPDDEITVEQHFCRVLDDCGHVDNTLEEAADQVASEYKRLYNFYIEQSKTGSDYYTDFKAGYAWKNHIEWKNRTHPSYLYYKEGVDISE
jgi:hypothetical protein